ncbi:hypothetical protein GOP47_0009532 [Adiantum capillus-veneris]|uniref:Uncharacterized protein n=1 Tax=Adiantum capillus-veneris TaxID=13818 RepID=A0A9D4UWZ4_ADICA|nr:hypothetical protein GOP47_0009532 [Adiantum capillus-veneris]
MQQGEGNETEVTWEDQQNINTFGRLNNKFHELEDDIKLKKVSGRSWFIIFFSQCLYFSFVLLHEPYPTFSALFSG